MSDWSIGQLAARAEVSVDTLRYYEKIKLLPRAMPAAGAVTVRPTSPGCDSSDARSR